eukprot:scaffold83988_cov28-Tisochrysis_lutea.AAC.5
MNARRRRLRTFGPSCAQVKKHTPRRRCVPPHTACGHRGRTVHSYCRLRPLVHALSEGIRQRGFPLSTCAHANKLARGGWARSSRKEEAGRRACQSERRAHTEPSLGVERRRSWSPGTAHRPPLVICPRIESSSRTRPSTRSRPPPALKTLEEQSTAHSTAMASKDSEVRHPRHAARPRSEAARAASSSSTHRLSEARRPCCTCVKGLPTLSTGGAAQRLGQPARRRQGRGEIAAAVSASDGLSHLSNLCSSARTWKMSRSICAWAPQAPLARMPPSSVFAVKSDPRPTFPRAYARWLHSSRLPW